jgi:tRNA(fMet)-specific endonuclease VapC
MKCLDTTFLIDLLRGAPAAVSQARSIQEAQVVLATPAPCVTELIRGLSKATPRTREAAHLLLDQLEVLPLDKEAARKSGDIAAETTLRGQEVSTVDCLIAGIVVVSRGTLVTRDQDFARIPGLSIETY